MKIIMMMNLMMIIALKIAMGSIIMKMIEISAIIRITTIINPLIRTNMILN